MEILINDVIRIRLEGIGKPAVEAVDVGGARLIEGEGGELPFLVIVPFERADGAAHGTDAGNLVGGEVETSMESARKSVIVIVGTGDKISGKDRIP